MTVPIRDLSVFIQWKPSISPMYITKIYAPDGNPSEIFHNEIRRSGILILAIEKPDFLKHRRYEAEAAVQFKVDKSECQIRLETIILDIRDFLTNNVEVKNINLINGNLEAFVTAVVCLSEIKLAATMPGDAQRKLENYFAIDCMLRELEFSGCKYFLADGISEIIDGAILKATEINDIYHLNISYRNKDQLNYLLHYLYSYIKDINILPLKYELNLISKGNEEPIFQTQHFVSQIPVVADPDIRKFGKCLRKQIEEVADFHLNVVDNKHIDDKEDVSEEYLILRNSIAEIELKADRLYERLSHDL